MTNHALRDPGLSRYLRMPIKVRSSGCLFSIIASVVLTVLLNLLSRGCGGYTV